MTLPPSTSAARALAPETLKNYRSTRYKGDDVCVSLSEIGPRDQVRIREIYDALRELFTVTAESTADAPAGFAADGKAAALIRAARDLGNDTPRTSPDLWQALHDIRGGALTALLGRLQLVEAGISVAEQARPIFLLARDHLKIMRNTLLEIDDPARTRDMETKPHSAKLLAEKWRDAEMFAGGRKIHFHFESDFDGDISERCIEFGSLDRVLYNLVNNAARHASEPVVGIRCLTMPGEGQPNLRFVVANSIAPEQAHALNTSLGDSLEGIFANNFSTTGSGLGLEICRLIVANAFGVPTPDQAVRDGYLGATIRQNSFLSWFHWPILA